MAARGAPFRGVLYAGLMITADGPKLIEYNVRFGDPETQVLMMRLDSDLLERSRATVDGRLAEVSLRWSDDAALTVVMAANGYPGAYAKGSAIHGIERAEALPGVKVFQAGTAAPRRHARRQWRPRPQRDSARGADHRRGARRAPTRRST